MWYAVLAVTVPEGPQASNRRAGNFDLVKIFTTSCAASGPGVLIEHSCALDVRALRLTEDDLPSSDVPSGCGSVFAANVQIRMAPVCSRSAISSRQRDRFPLRIHLYITQVADTLARNCPVRQPSPRSWQFYGPPNHCT